LTDQVYAALREAIMSGELPSCSRPPASRTAPPPAARLAEQNGNAPEGAWRPGPGSARPAEPV